MATAAAAYQHPAIIVPKNDVRPSGAPERVFLRHGVAERVALGNGDIVPVPDGFRVLVTRGRLCGDFYAELDGGARILSAVGETQDDALLALFAKAA